MLDARRALSSIPVMGAGLGYRPQIHAAIFRSRESIDFLEIVADNFIGARALMHDLADICEAFAVVPHGVDLSIGSVRLDREYLQQIKQISDATRAPYYSEHLAMTRGPAMDLGHLAPVWYDEESLDVVSRNVVRVQEELEKPLVLENITYPFEIPHGSMTQTEFFGRLAESTGCGILLDVTNVYTNAANHAFDPVAFLREMPLESVVQVHLAGGYWSNGRLIDSHSEPVEDASWGLLEEMANLTAVKAAIVEHDANFPDDFTTLLRQVTRAREIAFAPRAY